MVDWILGQPFLIAALFLTVVAGFRSQCTYWLGRAIRAGLVRARWAQKATGERAQKAVRALEKWGWPAIPISFLTVGFQTAVNLSAGVIGWRWGRYTLAAIPGWILWGSVYAAGGLAVFAGLAALAKRSPWAVVAALAIAAILVVAVIQLVKRLKAEAGEPVTLLEEELVTSA